MTTGNMNAGIPTQINQRKNYQGLSTLLKGLTAILFACMTLAGPFARAQSTGRGNITGIVTDPTGAVVVDAHVTITDIATNVALESITNGTGYFEIDNLDAATYKISVNATGFKQLIQNGVVLQASGVIRLPLKLAIGSTTEAISVMSDAPLLNLDSGLNGQSLTSAQLQALPVSGDNPMQFVELAPGVQSPGGVSQLYSMNGTLAWNGVSKFGTAGVSNVNEFSTDGAANEGNGRGNLISMNIDMVDQVRVDTTAFDPTVGHTMGVTVTETTKSGTNQLHGSVTHMYQNRRWAALPRFLALTYEHQQYLDGCTNGPSTSAQCFLDENKFGWPGVHENLTTFGVGGPVFIPKLYDGRKKFFFFVAGTNDIFTDAQQTTATIPTVQERNGKFSDLPTSTVPANYAAAFNAACPGSAFYGQYQLYNPYSTIIVNGHPSRMPLCGNIIPSGLLLNSKMATLINSWLPTPTNPNVTGGNYLYTSAQPQTFRQFTTREDYVLSDSDRIFVRFTRHHYTKAQPGIAPNGTDTQQGPKWAEIGALGWNHVFSPSTSVDVTLGGSNLETSFTNYPGYAAFPPSSVGLPSYADQYAGAAATLPELVFGPNGSTYPQGGSGANSMLFGNLNNAPSLYRTANVRVDLVHVQGRHSFRAGGEWRAQNYSRGIQGNSSGIYNFDTNFTQQNDGSNADCTGVGCNLGLASPSNYGLSYAAFLMGVQTTATVNKQAPISISTPYVAGYVGDTWRITPKLTLMPGLRFEAEAGPKEKHNYQIAEFDPNQSLAIAAPAVTAYAATYAGATAAQRAALPSTISVQGGPLYAGVNGAPEKQWDNNYRVLPRIGFAYQIRRDTVVHGGYGLYFDTLNALEWGGPTDQTNFTASTADAANAYWGNFGQNLTTATPPITNPFPVSTTGGSQFISAVGAAAGNLSYVGANPTIYPHSFVPARSQRAIVSVQHQFGQSLMVEVGWTGAWTSHMSNQSSGLVNAGGGGNTKNQNLAPVPASFFAGGTQPNVATNALLGQTVSNPFKIANFAALQSSNPAAYNQMSHSGTFTNSTIALSNLVRPYPFMGGLSLVNPVGESHFHELLVTVTKRMSHGLDLTVAYQRNYQYDRDYYVNPFDTALSWEPSNTSLPNHITAEGMYELPFGRNKMWATSGWKSALFGGLRINGTFEYDPGQLIEWGNMFYLGEIKASNIMLKHPIYNTNVQSGAFNVQWLNPGNVTSTVNPDGSCTNAGTGFVTNSSCQPNSYNLRAFPARVNGVRQQSINTTQASIQRNFRIKEGVGLEARFDVFDLFNRQILGSPNTSVTNSQFGFITGGAGSNGAGNSRWINIQGHLRF